ncbi:murein biosynthesis integral membrane protein MurJ [Rossellomorea vietnamensis]|uniref:Murein biosynthesis integral membrane protein MurJ n=1 Tax=Rossellomorea vietnamensis TaxID=218284 RepID=A0A5D4MD87_9BACI|nr:murein biosynthesis integral membrane protein MurJ [Rossellomorea vietnamensis]TYR98940.1 murein biosynthesis integral membrane protein MurJ [Rossellomorea vietnamensis]
MSKLKFASIIFLISTLFLKFSSMLRDLVIAHYFGASYIVDAYNAAMIIPNAFILFMLTGMKDAFVPSYIKYEADHKGKEHLTNIVKGTFIIGFIISFAGAVFAPVYFPLMYPEFTDSAINLGIWTAALYFATVFLVGINAIYEGYFDAQGKYSFATFSQTVVVLCTIGSAIFLHDIIGGYSLALGYLVGTVISFLIKFMYLKPRNFINWKQKMDKKEVYSYYKIFLPVGLTIMVGQINLTVNFLFAGQFGEGVISYLNYAFRLVSIPQAIFGVTTATIIYPILSRAMANNNDALFKTGIEKGLNVMILLLAPTITIMMILITEVVGVVYERGAFGREATLATSEVAVYYIGSVLFYSIQVIIAKGFYTLEKGHLILRIGLLSVVINVILNFVFSQLIGYQGLALSSSVVGLIYTVLCFIILYRIAGGFNLGFISKEYLKVIAAVIPAGLAVYFLKSVGGIEGLSNYISVPLLSIIGVVIYLPILFILKSDSLRMVLTRGKKES